MHAISVLFFGVGKEYVCIVRLHNAIEDEIKLARVSFELDNSAI